MDALKATGVARSYSGAAVLDNFSLTLAKGDFAALMGPSGSGKSTFLHIAAGLLKADAGKVEIAGREITAMGDSAAATWGWSSRRSIFSRGRPCARTSFSRFASTVREEKRSRP